MGSWLAFLSWNVPGDVCAAACIFAEGLKYSCRLGNFQAAQLDVGGLEFSPDPHLTHSLADPISSTPSLFPSLPVTISRCPEKMGLVWFGGKRNWFLNFPSLQQLSPPRRNLIIQPRAGENKCLQTAWRS